MFRRVPDIWIFIGVFFVLWIAAVAAVWKMGLLPSELRAGFHALVWLGAAAAWLAWRRRGGDHTSGALVWLGLATVTPRAVAASVLGFAAILGVAAARDAALGTLGLEASDFALAALALRLLVVTQEELVFRGVIQTRLAERGSAVAAVLIATVLFIAIHVPGWAIPGGQVETWGGGITLRGLVTVAYLGLLCGALRAWTRSLWPGLAVHWANNIGAVMGD